MLTARKERVQQANERINLTEKEKELIKKVKKKTTEKKVEFLDLLLQKSEPNEEDGLEVYLEVQEQFKTEDFINDAMWQ